MVVWQSIRQRNSATIVENFTSMDIKYKADFHEFALREEMLQVGIVNLLYVAIFIKRCRNFAVIWELHCIGKPVLAGKGTCNNGSIK